MDSVTLSAILSVYDKRISRLEANMAKVELNLDYILDCKKEVPSKSQEKSPKKIIYSREQLNDIIRSSVIEKKNSKQEHFKTLRTIEGKHNLNQITTPEVSSFDSLESNQSSRSEIRYGLLVQFPLDDDDK